MRGVPCRRFMHGGFASLVVTVAALVAPIQTLATGSGTGANASAVSLGEALYHGRVELPGRIRGHDLNLPTQATRCINCHLGMPTPLPAGSPTARTQTFGPALTAAHLTQAQSRRGGPPTRYDPKSFCTVLRDGLDPAKVQMPRTMPLYPLTDEQCSALWAYLTADKAPR
jgi:hypothetical protein